MLAVQILHKQTTTKAMNSETLTENNGPENTTKMYITVILRTMLHKEDKKKNDRNLNKFGKV